MTRDSSVHLKVPQTHRNSLLIQIIQVLMGTLAAVWTMRWEPRLWTAFQIRMTKDTWSQMLRAPILIQIKLDTLVYLAIPQTHCGKSLQIQTIEVRMSHTSRLASNLHTETRFNLLIQTVELVKVTYLTRTQIKSRSLMRSKGKIICVM